MFSLRDDLNLYTSKKYNEFNSYLDGIQRKDDKYLMPLKFCQQNTSSILNLMNTKDCTLDLTFANESIKEIIEFINLNRDFGINSFQILFRNKKEDITLSFDRNYYSSNTTLLSFYVRGGRTTICDGCHVNHNNQKTKNDFLFSIYFNRKKDLLKLKNEINEVYLLMTSEDILSYKDYRKPAAFAERMRSDYRYINSSFIPSVILIHSVYKTNPFKNFMQLHEDIKNRNENKLPIKNLDDLEIIMTKIDDIKTHLYEINSGRGYGYSKERKITDCLKMLIDIDNILKRNNFATEYKGSITDEEFINLALDSLQIVEKKKVKKQ